MRTNGPQLYVCLTVLSRPQPGWATLGKRTGTVGPLLARGKQWVTVRPQAGPMEVYQYFGLRQDALVLSPSSQTELRLSNRSMSLFWLHDRVVCPVLILVA